MRRKISNVVCSCVFLAVANLGVSTELQAKLQDVMVVRSLLSIGKVLGEGERLSHISVT